MIGPCGLGPILLEVAVAGTLKPKIRRCYFFGSTSQLYLKYWKTPTTTATTLAIDPPMQLSPGLRLVLCEACAQKTLRCKTGDIEKSRDGQVFLCTGQHHVIQGRRPLAALH